MPKGYPLPFNQFFEQLVPLFDIFVEGDHAFVSALRVVHPFGELRIALRKDLGTAHQQLLHTHIDKFNRQTKLSR